METDDSIYFYGTQNKFGFLSNFYESHFKDDENHSFCCSEQYFMYQKAKTFDSENEALLQQILNERNPSKIKYLGRCVKNYNESIWSKKRYDVMLQALRYKFSQNLTLKEKLLNTKDKILYESSKYDKIWGIGFYDHDAITTDKKYFGMNLLGKALMTIREEFKKNVSIL